MCRRFYALTMKKINGLSNVVSASFEKVEYNERQSARGVSFGSRNGAPFPKGYVVNIQMT